MRKKGMDGEGKEGGKEGKKEGKQEGKKEGRYKMAG